MSKLDQLRREVGANVKDSTGAERAAAGHAAGQAGPPARWQGVKRSSEVCIIPVAKIVRDPDQPRTEFDPEELAMLAESLKARGQLQPIRVRWSEEQGAYVVVVGERRWRAASLAGLEALACVVDDAPMGADERLMVQLVENALRSDLKPVEQARAYRRLMDARGYSTHELAKELHLSQSAVSKALALLELPEAVQQQVDGGTLAPSAAYEISKLLEPELQAEVAGAAVAQGLNRSEVAEVVAAVRAKRPAPAARPEPVTIEVEPGVVVKVSWKKAGGPDLVKVLRTALKRAQEGAQGDQAA